MPSSYYTQQTHIVNFTTQCDSFAIIRGRFCYYFCFVIIITRLILVMTAGHFRRNLKSDVHHFVILIRILLHFQLSSFFVCCFVINKKEKKQMSGGRWLILDSQRDYISLDLSFCRKTDSLTRIFFFHLYSIICLFILSPYIHCIFELIKNNEFR